MSAKSIRVMRRGGKHGRGDLNRPAWNSGGLPPSGFARNANLKTAPNVWRRERTRIEFSNNAQVAMRKNL